MIRQQTACGCDAFLSSEGHVVGKSLALFMYMDYGKRVGCTRYGCTAARGRGCDARTPRLGIAAIYLALMYAAFGRLLLKHSKGGC
ncbi:hypothetical protein FHG87_020977 [Trinorchestia longiramus]|nr:hypothetical protein FHG87_020977 [Trinorchestia longiramus]